MKATKFIMPSLLISALLALIYRLFAHVSVGSASATPVSRDTAYDAIDTYIERQMHRLHIPGASLAIVEGDRIDHQRGFGRARPGGEVPTARTPFFIGSLTKSFTALAVMQLVEAGKVELDAPVQRYLPWFCVADPEASANMTVRHLLNQTSSLPVLPGLLDDVNFDDHPNAIEHQVRALSTLKITHPVGTKCEYSNLNYNILGLIIEVASGQSYSDYVQQHIFKPLEMSHSYTAKAEAQQDGLAMGYRHWFSLPFPEQNLPVPLGSLPSGQLISCSEDMAHYLIAHLNEGHYGDVQILSSTGIDELHRGVKEYITFGISSGRYGMGWFDSDLGQTKTFSHSGNVPDYSAFMALLPEQKRGVVLLFNADPYVVPPITEEIGMGVTALLSGQQPAPIRLDFIQWIMRLLPLIPLLQITSIIATLRMLRRWDRNPALRPSKSSKWVQHFLLPLIPNLSMAALLSYLRTNGVMRYLHVFNPDLAWTIRISGKLAGIWTYLRIKTLRKSS